LHTQRKSKVIRWRFSCW